METSFNKRNNSHKTGRISFSSNDFSEKKQVDASRFFYEVASKRHLKIDQLLKAHFMA